jgi:acetolactate decarboxylase
MRLVLSSLTAILLFASLATGRTVTQISTIDSLLVGNYDGSYTIGDLLKAGDFGIGTFDRLDGEMVVWEGIVYRVSHDGTVSLVPDDETTPFAAIAPFEREVEVNWTGTWDFDDLERKLDPDLPSLNLFYAVLWEGTFDMVKARSVPRQERPYRPLLEVAAEQSEFSWEGISGIMVGFRCPDYVQGINVPRYHLHFLSDCRTKGGHVLDFQVSEGQAGLFYQVLNEFRMILPKDDPYFRGSDLTLDRVDELHKIER